MIFLSNLNTKSFGGFWSCQAGLVCIRLDNDGIRLGWVCCCCPAGSGKATNRRSKPHRISQPVTACKMLQMTWGGEQDGKTLKRFLNRILGMSCRLQELCFFLCLLVYLYVFVFWCSYVAVSFIFVPRSFPLTFGPCSFCQGASTLSPNSLTYILACVSISNCNVL